MKKVKRGRLFIIAVILLSSVVYLIINGPRRTVKVAYSEFEDKISFEGFYFIEEHVIYNGDTKGIGLKYKTGDMVSVGTLIADGLTADEAGMLITHIDGYENKYDRKNIMDIKPSEIKKIASNTNISSGIKIVNNSQWYICALLNDEDGKYFKKGMQRDVKINNKYLIADIIEVISNGESVILICRFKNDLDVEGIGRAISGYVVKSRNSGITIPEKSIIDYNGSKGVFVNLNGYAEFRKIKVLSILDGKAVVIPDKDSKPKLMEYDEVILNPDGLIDGKKIR